MESLDLKEKFVVLSPDKQASTEANTPDLYERIGNKYGDFKNHELIAIDEFKSNWPDWELHPYGDEIVMLLTGEIILILDFENKQQQIQLRNQGEYAIVPKGVWHTAHIKENARVLFITPGEGTENRDI